MQQDSGGGVFDLETNTDTTYSSLREAAKALDCLVGSIAYNLKNGKKPLAPVLPYSRSEWVRG